MHKVIDSPCREALREMVEAVWSQRVHRAENQSETDMMEKDGTLLKRISGAGELPLRLPVLQ